MKACLIACSVLMLASCSKEWKQGTLSGNYMLEGAQARSGGHCESSAMLNALVYQGYEVNEPMIAGGGGALSFMFEKSAFPWLSARNGDLREVFFEGSLIKWHKRVPDSEDFGWQELYSLLEAGTPVILRVDMRYLPYLYNGKYGSPQTSFGWHMITLFGIDSASQLAFVSDTSFSALQKISLKDLHRARSSRIKVFPPQGEFYWVEKRNSGYVLDWDRLAALSIKTALANYEWRDESSNSQVLAGLAGLEKYGEALAELETYSDKKFLLPAVFDFMAGNIEDFGTGGAAFRVLYRDFLVQARDNSRFSGLDTAITALDEAIVSWHQLSDLFRKAAKTVKGMSDPERKALYSEIRTAAEGLYKKEKTFYDKLKIVYTEGNNADNR